MSFSDVFLSFDNCNVFWLTLENTVSNKPFNCFLFRRAVFNETPTKTVYCPSPFSFIEPNAVRIDLLRHVPASPRPNETGTRSRDHGGIGIMLGLLSQ